MIEIVEFDLAKFNQEGQIAEELMGLAYKKEQRILTENDRKLIAKLMVCAAYRKDNGKIDQYINFIYKRLFGDRWYENQVWMDQPINWLDIDLIRYINGCYKTTLNYDELVKYALNLIEELWKDRHQIIKYCAIDVH